MDPRYTSAQQEWADELNTQRAVHLTPEPRPPRNRRDSLRTRPPQTERDANGRITPRADCRPGWDIH